MYGSVTERKGNVARIGGRNGWIYLAIASAGTAEPIAFQNKWTLNSSSDKIEVTAFGDGNKVYVAGLPDASGAFSGFYDDATAQTYTASQDGIARKFYLYPSLLTSTQYFFGTVLVDFSAEGGVADAVTSSSSWSASSTVFKVG
jgi:hypothetical protein